MSSVFSTLHESLQQVLAQRLDWTELREVQERAYTAVAAGKDVLVIAPTAGGKSEAALIPVMDDILKHGRMGVSCLYISPLKALINDQEDRFREFCVPTSLSVMKWHGDVAKGDRGWKDGEPPHFLMITPESLEVLLQEKTLSLDLRRVRTVIIDELHAFVESERGVQLKVLLSELDRITRRPVQRVGLSATTGNPEEVLSWLSDNRHGSELVAIPAPPKDKQFRFIVEEDEEKRIDALVGIVKGRKALVFVNSRSIAEKLMRSASDRIRNLHIHHSSLSLATRKASEEAFSSQDGACIICTSTLELGIDIGDLDVVVQVGPPNSVSSFLQRLGRSGRRGKAAYVAWLLKDPCDLLCSVAIIECAMNKEVEPLTPLKKPYNVLVQQVFLYLFRHARASRRQLVTSVLSHTAFAEIRPAMLDRIVTYLIELGYLTPDGEMVMLGEMAEREFGRSNFKDLYSVIMGGGEYRAVTPDGEVVGKLDARFVNSRNDGEISLGGQGWSMVKCDEGHNLVVVVPSGSTTSGIFWTGSESGYSPLVCRQVQAIGARGESLLPLSDDDKEILRMALIRIPEGVGPTGLYIRERKGEKGVMVTVYSFNGSGFNRLLTLLLQHRLGSKAQVRYNDFVIRILRTGKEGAGERVTTALHEIQGMGPEEMGSVLPLPSIEGWKFARALPEPPFREMALTDHYHIDEFMESFGEMTVSVLPVPMPDLRRDS
ncbi:MAG: DEAD/DEAH box helicase [Methanoregula sp.]|nr:DEAD/DEAH box helicase [Methanoregula sp.]